MLGHIRDHDITLYLTADDTRRLSKQVVVGSAVKKTVPSLPYRAVDINMRINDDASNGEVAMREGYVPRFFLSVGFYESLVERGHLFHTLVGGDQMALYIIERQRDPDLLFHYREIERVLDELRKLRPAPRRPSHIIF